MMDYTCVLVVCSPGDGESFSGFRVTSHRFDSQIAAETAAKWLQRIPDIKTIVIRDRATEAE